MRRTQTLILNIAFAITLLVPLHALANMGADDSSPATGDPTIEEAKKAVDARDWKRAVELLTKAAASDPNNANVQNWLGFAQRKSGNLDAAFSAYNAALQLNPGHKAAHEYIGEAYLMTGNLAKAEEHLAQLQKLCNPIPCEEYNDLRGAVDDYKKTHAKK
ncbi:MAG: tetratricopeptide repeat protein [Betaproteobacteria bacterium]